eukprot:12228492-Prorocentrum_lima.AAC.1
MRRTPRASGMSRGRGTWWRRDPLQNLRLCEVLKVAVIVRDQIDRFAGARVELNVRHGALE